MKRTTTSHSPSTTTCGGGGLGGMTGKGRPGHGQGQGKARAHKRGKRSASDTMHDGEDDDNDVRDDWIHSYSPNSPHSDPRNNPTLHNTKRNPHNDKLTPSHLPLTTRLLS